MSRLVMTTLAASCPGLFCVRGKYLLFMNTNGTLFQEVSDVFVPVCHRTVP